MNAIGISACAVMSTLAGMNNTSGKIFHKEQDNNIVESASPQEKYVKSGNKIGHNPANPKKFILPKESKLIKTLKDVVTLFQDSYHKPHLYKALYYRFTDKGLRKIRSEFSEMISIGSAIITNYYDVVTGEIGFLNEHGKWVCIKYKTLSKKLGVSLIRIKRFINFLKMNNWFRTEHKKEFKKGIWKNTVRKFINANFFIQGLGKEVWEKIQLLKQWKLKNMKGQTKREKRNASQLLGMVRSSLSPALKECSTIASRSLSTGSKQISQILKKCSTPTKYIDPEENRRRNQLAMQRYRDNPSKPPTEHLKDILAGM